MKIATSLCALCLATPAWADDTQNVAKQPSVEQSSTDKANEKFKALDRNHDQHISHDEARSDPALDKRFASADSNGDGQLDQAEFQSKPSEKPSE
jgi:Ca2+-binding EF-hand superfamily protein